MAPEVWTFDQMVQARYIRVRPHDGPHSDNNQHDVFLWVELLGCKPVSPSAPPCPGTRHRCASGECVPKGEGHVTVLWTAKTALMRRAVGPFVQAPAAESIPRLGPQASPPLSLESFHRRLGRVWQTQRTSSPSRNHPCLLEGNPCRRSPPSPHSLLAPRACTQKWQL